MIHEVAAMHYDPKPHADFQRALKRRVVEYLRAQPNGRKANGFMWMKIVGYLAAYWTTWGALALTEHSLPVTLVLIAWFSVLVVAVAYNISHDAVHHAISRRPWVNEVLFHGTFNLLGPNAYLWRLRHAEMHHSCVNIPGYDFNIEAAGILRFAPTQPWRPIHRFQHLYAPLAYALFTIHWVFVNDFVLMRLSEIGNVKAIRHPWYRWAEVIGYKLVYVGYMLVIPTLATSWTWWQVLAGYLLYQALVSMQFVLTFVGSHLNVGLVFVENGEGNHIPHSYLEHALHTSMDFDPKNRFVSFWLGGFNGHVAHHMFPSVCSVHYPALTTIIEQTAKEYGLPYKVVSTWTMLVNHFRYLKDMGEGPDAPKAAYMHRPAGA